MTPVRRDEGGIVGPPLPVKGRWVELRVLDPVELGPSRFDASDAMLDPWVELPLPASRMTVVGEFGPLPAPDGPAIPADEEGT
jgi:hypothetical protein